jgi:hypothetical protein
MVKDQPVVRLIKAAMVQDQNAAHSPETVKAIE